MDFIANNSGREQDIYELFLTTFTASEGTEEGKIIGRFVEDLMSTTPARDLFCFLAYEIGFLVGAVFFSRLSYAKDNRTVFILSPMAVKTDRQKSGIGQKLIAHALDELRKNKVDIVLTYGDINFYSKLGFQQISEDLAQAPVKLSYPEGWLAKSLIQKDFKPLIGSSKCVVALNKPELW